MRQAIIKQTGIGNDYLRVERYLPGNYHARVINADTVLIEGFDSYGWTLDGYVIPRLATGLIWAEEVTR